MSVKSYLKQVFGKFSLVLVACRIIPNRIIIRMDGGICSQMHFYLVGSMLERRGKKVWYDLRWYKTDGKDLDGKFCRNFDLLKLFPNLNFHDTRSVVLRQIYISSFYRRNDYFDNDSNKTAWLECGTPTYLDGYFHDTEEMYGQTFRKLFEADTSVLPETNISLKNRIIETSRTGDTCAVHIRRGDLARYNRAYGDPVGVDYITKSFAKVSEHACGKVSFFLFSDEPEWFRTTILPQLNKYEITICDINGSDRGWCDLLLMSLCHHQITSHGSMGKFAALMRPEGQTDGLVTLPPNSTSAEWQLRYPTAVIISTDEEK